MEKINGVSTAYAKRIIANRPYASVQDLSKSGIPASRLTKIVPQVTVGKEVAGGENTASNDKGVVKSRTADNAPASTSSKSAATAAKSTDKTPTEARTPPQKGMVWVNTSSKIYHVEGDKWYGKTKKGEWMTEEDAIKAGNRKAK